MRTVEAARMDAKMPRLADLERRRAIECRLTPDRALTTLEQAAAFLSERGMLTRMPDCALPSLFGACHEEPAQAGSPGFGQWPKTKWIWSFQLTSRFGAVLTKLHRGKSLYLSLETARIFDPLVRQAIAAAEGDDARLLDHLAGHGPAMSEDIELELGWDRRRLKRARDRLERVGAILSDGLVFENASTWYFAPMRRWDQVIAKPAQANEPHSDVVLAGVRAAVIAPEPNIRSWFSWPVPAGTVEGLVSARHITRPQPGWVAISARLAPKVRNPRRRFQAVVATPPVWDD